MNETRTCKFCNNRCDNLLRIAHFYAHYVCLEQAGWSDSAILPRANARLMQKFTPQEICKAAVVMFVAGHTTLQTVLKVMGTVGAYPNLMFLVTNGCVAPEEIYQIATNPSLNDGELSEHVRVACSELAKLAEQEKSNGNSE